MNQYLYRNNIEEFKQTVSLLNVYIEEKLMNNFLMAWLELKDLYGGDGECIKMEKISNSNVVIRNSSGYESREQKKFKTCED